MRDLPQPSLGTAHPQPSLGTASLLPMAAACSGVRRPRKMEGPTSTRSLLSTSPAAQARARDSAVADAEIQAQRVPSSGSRWRFIVALPARCTRGRKNEREA